MMELLDGDNWYLKENTETEILFEKKMPSYEIIKIKKIGERLMVSLPLKNSVYQYNTYMEIKNEELIYDYIKNHIY